MVSTETVADRRATTPRAPPSAARTGSASRRYNRSERAVGEVRHRRADGRGCDDHQPSRGTDGRIAPGSGRRRRPGRRRKKMPVPTAYPRFIVIDSASPPVSPIVVAAILMIQKPERDLGYLAAVDLGNTVHDSIPLAIGMPLSIWIRIVVKSYFCRVLGGERYAVCRTGHFKSRGGKVGNKRRGNAGNHRRRLKPAHRCPAGCRS